MSDGTVIRSVIIDEPSRVVKWENLLSATNYTVQIFSNEHVDKQVIASAWAVTQKAYRAPTVTIDIPFASVTNNSLNVRIYFNSGSENKTAYGRLLLENSSVVESFKVDKPSVFESFQELVSGTKYIVEVYTYLNGSLKSRFILAPKRAKKFAISSTTFGCKFQPWQDNILSVRWTVQRKERNFTLTKVAEHVKDVQSLSLTEEDLVNNHIFLPFHISCAVAEGHASLDTNFSVSSELLFAGIKILTPMITMHRDETAAILFSPTIPFGCTRMQTTEIDTCNLTLAISIPVSKNCTGISTRKCTINVPGNAGSRSSLQIQATEDGQYGVQKDATHKVILRTNHVSNDSIWRDYTLPAVTVLVKPETSTYYRGKRCEALNDPHMYTFDGKRYEHHEHLSDEYVMYTHVSYTAK
ncbi:uncharacterized protein LOC132756311, partial [Ruditapes philippinarum]|uniref:uncharacterized protein LOC132756311 n=1 Tax=Ruditapes philippinarum TaxID=129788 RepID=UPI00295AF4C8